MKLVSSKVSSMNEYVAGADGTIYSLIIDISDIDHIAREMLDALRDTSWVEKLDIIDKLAYEARAEPTIERLSNAITNRVEDEITAEFGEYMVSISSQVALENHLDHLRLPLADLIKEKVAGNPAFDFHTQTPTELINFGEAKYSGVNNRYSEALDQIINFIQQEKDIRELSDLRKFVCENAVENAAIGNKSYCAAFSIVSNNKKMIMNNALTHTLVEQLCVYDELYLIGICVA